jgi:gamma-glutamyltranspeptidase/glutathione hydrolase
LNFSELFIKSDGSLYQEGDTMVRPKLADTLSIIANDSYSFYNGKLAQAVVEDLKEIGN